MSLFRRKKQSNGHIGYLVFDTSMPDTPYLALDQAADLDAMRNMNFVTLKVIRADTSQK